MSVTLVAFIFQHTITFPSSLKSRLKAHTPFMCGKYNNTKLLKADCTCSPLYVSIGYWEGLMVRIAIIFVLFTFTISPLQLQHYMGKEVEDRIEGVDKA